MLWRWSWRSGNSVSRQQESRSLLRWGVRWLSLCLRTISLVEDGLKGERLGTRRWQGSRMSSQSNVSGKGEVGQICWALHYPRFLFAWDRNIQIWLDNNQHFLEHILEKSRAGSVMAGATGLIPSIVQRSWVLDLSSQVTHSCGDIVVLVVPSLHLFFQNPQYQDSPQNFRKVAKLNLLALSESCVYASVNHQGQGHGVLWWARAVWQAHSYSEAETHAKHRDN